MNDPAHLVLAVHALATFAMFGIIWVVQLVHYPMLAAIPAESFVGWHEFHTRRIGYVVGPLMVVEAVTAAWLVHLMPGPLTLAGLVLVVFHIAATALLSVPCHRRLAEGYDAEVVRRLVSTNWLRTAIWTARAGLVLGLLSG